MKLEKQDNKFRVLTQEFRTQWYPDNPSNRKIVLIMLRGLQKENGEALFSFKNLAVIVESKNQQAASQHVEDFREYGEDFFQTIWRKRRKMYEDLRETVIKVLRKNPLLDEEIIAEKAGDILGKNIKRGVVRLTLENIGCTEIRQILKKQIEKGEVHYKEQYLIERMFAMVNEKVKYKKTVQQICSNPKKLKASETVEASSVKLSNMHRDIQQVFDAKVNRENLAAVWDSTLGWKLLAFVLYFNGMSQGVIGRWFGVNKSTICRWLKSISDISTHWTENQKFSSSNKVAVDEKWIKIAGKWWYLFAAVDVITGCPLHTAIYPGNNTNYCKLFLSELKNRGYKPKVIITDGWDAYIKAIKYVFPDAKHLLCRFHALHSVFRRFNKARIFSSEVSSAIGKLFNTQYKRTVLRRVAKLENMLISSHAIETVLGGLKKKLPILITTVGSKKFPSTSNAVENFFSQFDRFYRLKGAFSDVSSAQKNLQLFIFGYLFSITSKGQPCPLERANVKVSNLPIYHLINRPNIVALRQRIALQHQIAA